jgi:hypothetical protein
MADRNLSTYYRGGQYGTREGMIVEIPPSGFDWGGSVPPVIDPFAETVSQQFPLGTKLTYGGRTFRYTHNGGVVQAAGSLYQSVVPAAGELDEALEDGVAVGDTGITFTQTTGADIDINTFRDGYLNVRDETGEGNLYLIHDHIELTNSAAEEITLVDPILVVPANAATGDLIRNPYKAVIIHPSPNTARIVGLAVRALTASYYGWLQTSGMASVLTDGTVVIGEHVRASDGTDGSVEALVRAGTNEDEQEVGTVVAVSASTEYSLIHLTLE